MIQRSLRPVAKQKGVKEQNLGPNVGGLVIRIGFWGPLSSNSIGNYIEATIVLCRSE